MRRAVALAALSGAVVCSTSCDDDSAGDGDGDEDGQTDDDGGVASPCDSDDEFEWDGVTYSNGAPSEEAIECDPLVEGTLLYEGMSIAPSGPPLGFTVGVLWGEVPGQAFPQTVGLQVFDETTPLTEGANLPFDGLDSTITVIDSPDGATVRDCRAEFGEATITRLPDAGEYVEGTYTVTAWDDSSQPDCPTPANGQFSFNRFN